MIEVLKHSSLAIKGFPMGDPHERSLSVYLPPEYSAKRSEPYPVLFVLAGWAGRSSKYLSDGSVFETPLHLKLDEAIKKKELPEVIVAFADGTSRFGSSQYINSPALGNYMNYICDELIDLVDSKFHTHKSAEFRGILGHSSGGFGALVNGFLRSDRFKYISSAAGDSFFEYSILPTAVPTLIEIEKSGGLEKFIDSIFSHPQPSSLGSKKMHALMTLCLAGCYAPNISNAPVYGDLFFDLRTGSIIEEIWEKYLNWDPIHLIDRHAEAASELKFVHLDCGLQDEYGLQFGHRRLHQKIKKLGIPSAFEEYPGGHSGNTWRYLNRIQTILKKMYSVAV